MNNILSKIKEECTQFIELSEGNYAQKSLLFDGRFIKKVKVRKKKNKDNFLDLFDKAFEQEYRDIMGRSIFCNGVHSKPNVINREKFYVFPINGFKVLYNPDFDYYKEYMNIYSNLKENLDQETAKKTFIDMIEYSYKINNLDLSNALFSGNEIIFYGIPYYYAVKCSKHPDYKELLRTIYQS
jgi:hypothetical protein